MKKFFISIFIFIAIFFFVTAISPKTEALTVDQDYEGMDCSDGTNAFALDEVLTESPKTYEAMIKLNANLNGYGRYGVVFGSYYGSEASASMELSKTGQLRFYYWQNSKTLINQFSKATITPGEWTHIAIVRDNVNGILNMYINGVKESYTFANAKTEVISDLAFCVGKDHRLNSKKTALYPLQGEIAYVSASSQVKTDAQIQESINTKGATAYATGDLYSWGYNNMLERVSEGLSFTSADSYSMQKKLTKMPKTYEATIVLPENRAQRLGEILGNYSGTDWTACYSFEIHYNSTTKVAYPKLYYDVDNVGTTNPAVSNINFGNINFNDLEAFPLGEEIHLAITHDEVNNIATCYINGVAMQTLTLTDNATYGEYEFVPNLVGQIGGDCRECNTNYFKGYIKNTKYYSDVRTAEEIANDYATASELITENTDENLLAAYNFTQPTGYLKDLSGNGYDLSEPNGIDLDNYTGSTFEAENRYEIIKKFSGEQIPHSIEAEIYIPAGYTGRAGVIFGAYNDGDKEPNLSLEINSGNNLRFRFGSSLGGTDRFDKSVNIGKYIGGWIHIAVTHNVEKQTITFWANGEDVLVVSGTDYKDYGDIFSNIYYCLGGDYRITTGSGFNNTYYKHNIRSLTLYSDVRSAAEIRVAYSDLERDYFDVNDENLILRYELDNIEDKNEIVDLSGNGFDIEIHNKTMVYDYNDEGHWQECIGCENVFETVTIEEHTLVAKSDAENHWKECSVCKAVYDKTAHTYEHKNNEEKHWEECSCGSKTNESAHVFNQKVATEEYNTGKATYLYYYSCSCGAAGSEVFASGEVTLYLVPGPWNVDGAKFTIYYWDETTGTKKEGWAPVTPLASGTSLCVFKLDAEAMASGLIAVRLNSSATTGNWSAKWNQTADLKLPLDGNDTLTITGWDASNYKWSKHTHTEVVDQAVAATCTTSGLTEGKHCSVCGEILKVQEQVEALGHKNAEAVKENEKASTCVVAGSYDLVVYCSVCEKEVSRTTEELPLAAHIEEIVTGKAATCTETGLTEGKKCSVCNEVLEAQEEIAALGHSYVAGVCSTCGATDPNHYFEMNIEEALAAKDNTKVSVSGTVVTIDTVWSDSFGNISVTIKDETGKSLYLYRMKTKVVVGDIITVKGVMATYNGSRQVAAGSTAEITGHDTSYDYVEMTVLEALAAADGKNVIITGTVVEIKTAYSTQYKNISVDIADENGNRIYLYRLSGNVSVGQIIKVKGATATYKGAKQIVGATFELVGTHECVKFTEATCTVAKKCVVCGKASGEALGHTEVIEAGYAATCTKAGLSDGKHCSVCNAVLATQQTIPALGHTEVVDEAKAATCEVTGLTEGKHCSVCNEVLVAQTEVAALGHKYGNVTYTWSLENDKVVAEVVCENDESHIISEEVETKVVVKSATCTEAGLNTYTATFTNDLFATQVKEEVIKATGKHVYVNIKHNAELHWYECGCGAKGVVSSHEFDVEVIKAATCDEGGTNKLTCTVCEESKTVEVPMLTHSFTEFVSNNDATCTTNGTETALCDHGCGAVATHEVLNSKIEHAWDEGKVLKRPTRTEEGLTRFTCTECGLVVEEVVERLTYEGEPSFKLGCNGSMVSSIIGLFTLTGFVFIFKKHKEN